MIEAPAWAQGEGWEYCPAIVHNGKKVHRASAVFKTDRFKVIVFEDGCWDVIHFEFLSPEESRRIADAIIRTLRETSLLCPKCNYRRKMMGRDTCMACREPSETEALDALLGRPSVPCSKCGQPSYTGVCFMCEA